MHKRCSGIRGKVKENSKFKCQTCANQQTDVAVDCPGIELNSQFLETMKKFYLDGAIVARGGATDSVITKIRSGWYKLTDLVPLFASRGLPLEAKGRLYSACVRTLCYKEARLGQLAKEM